MSICLRLIKCLGFLRDDDRFKMLERSIIFQDIEEVYTHIEDLSNPFIQLFMAEQNNKRSTELTHSEQSDLDTEIVKLRDPIIKWQEQYKTKIHNYLVKSLDPNPRDVRDYNALLTKLREIDGNLKNNHDQIMICFLTGRLMVIGVMGFKPSIYGDPIKTWDDLWDF